MTASTATALAALTVAAAPAAAAGEPASIVHPIYAQMPEAPQNDVGQRELTRAAARYKLLPVEVVDIEQPPPPPTGAVIKAGVDLVKKLAFDDARKQLDAADDTVTRTGGAGLTTAELSDLYLARAMAIARADWKPDRSVDQATRVRAYEDYVRAATLTPDRTLNPHDYPPQTMEDWAKAVAEISQRPQGTLTVTGSSRALITFDGKPPLSARGGVTFKAVYGQHFVAVEEPGRARWGSSVLVNSASSEVPIPGRAALSLDDAVAAAHARRMGAKFALVAELLLGEGPTELQLRLVDVTGIRHDATVVPLTGEPGAIDAATMRLDEEARRIEHLGLAPGTSLDPTPAGSAAMAPPVLVSPPAATRPTLSDDPGAWARAHWPLLTAVGALVGASLVLGLTVGLE
ncbi:MAG TPA: hypothetical protein VFH68_15265 [Polyangia bacterium]|nr:hypothetical protein [Polyangia bacterium]